MGSQDATADFYFKSREYNLVSPNHVWVGLNPPTPLDNSDMDVYGPTAQDDLSGFVIIYGENSSPYDPQGQKFNATWGALSNINSTRFPPWGQDFSVAATYDCTKVMLYGLHEFLQNNPQFSPDMLANGSLNSYLTIDKFANTGYEGVTYHPTTLNEDGDLNAPIVFITINWTSLTSPDIAFDNTTGFGATDFAATYFDPLPNVPVFYGGSSIPPPDGPVPQLLQIDWNSKYGITIACLSFFGVLLSLTMLGFLYRFQKTTVVKSMSLVFTSLYTCGVIIGNVSLLSYLGPVSTTSCSARIWISLLAAALTLGCSWVKNLRVYVIFYASSHMKLISKRMKKYTNDRFLAFILICIVMISVILLVIWNASFDPKGYYLSNDRSKSTLICFTVSQGGNHANVSQSIFSAIIAYIATLLSGTAWLGYSTGSIYDTVSESSFLIISTGLGTVGLAVSLVTTSLEPSERTLFIRPLVTWFVINVSMVFLYLPKMVEALAEVNENASEKNLKMNLPTSSLFSEREELIAKTISTASSIMITGEVERPVKHLYL
ncbi:hypothetical protein HDU76_009247, partial [Blyttiomyces sp. JEL0837]